MTPRRSRRRAAIDLARADLTAVALRARAGDPEAERAFIGRTMDDVWRFCAHTLGPGSADDATQATYLRALKSLKNFRGDSTARTWLIGVAKNVCKDEFRSRQRHQRIAAAALAQPTETTAPDLHGSLETIEAMGALPEERREAFVLTQFLGFSYEEAAAIAGCAVGTIRSRVARARSQLMAEVAAAEASTGTA